MTRLIDAKVGKKIKISSFIDPSVKCYSNRFGLQQGQVIKCIAKPGPVIIQKNNQEIAIGRGFSKLIAVSEVS